MVAESVPEAKVIAAFFGKSHFSDGHDGIPEHLLRIALTSLWLKGERDGGARRKAADGVDVVGGMW